MNILQKYILKKIAKKLVVQGHTHQFNIIQYYDIIREAAKNEFTEDNTPTLNAFLKECFDTSLNEAGIDNELHLNRYEEDCEDYVVNGKIYKTHNYGKEPKKS